MRTVAQPSLPLGQVSPDELARKRDFGEAIELSASVAGYDLDKQASADIAMDKAQWSRIKSGQEGIKWWKLEAFLDSMGNDIPLFWMLHQRGYDVLTIRKRETEIEKLLRAERELREAAELRVQVLTEALTGRAPA